MPDVHAVLSASAAHRWMNCPGSISLCQGIPDKGSSYAEEGTLAHSLAELIINYNLSRMTKAEFKKAMKDIESNSFYCQEMQDYIKSLYGLEPDDRIFPISKAYLHHEMNRGAKAAGVKRVRIHDLRHSHVSLLIEMGFSAVAIAERVGHESIDITYRYAHLFPSKQAEMANKLDDERMVNLNVG